MSMLAQTVCLRAPGGTRGCCARYKCPDRHGVITVDSCCCCFCCCFLPAASEAAPSLPQPALSDMSHRSCAADSSWPMLHCTGVWCCIAPWNTGVEAYMAWQAGWGEGGGWVGGGGGGGGAKDAPPYVRCEGVYYDASISCACRSVHRDRRRTANAGAALCMHAPEGAHRHGGLAHGARQVAQALGSCPQAASRPRGTKTAQLGGHGRCLRLLQCLFP